MPREIAEVDDLTFRADRTNGYRLTRLYYLADLDLYQEKRAFHASSDGPRLFAEWLAEYRLIDPDEAAEVGVCHDCDEADYWDDMSTTASGDRLVCQSCLERDYSYCNDCEGYVPDNAIRSIEDEVVCDRCYDNGPYSWCDSCDVYYNYNQVSHAHDEDDDRYCNDCVSPEQAFTFGLDRLPQDTSATVALPAGVITDQGLSLISEHLKQIAYEGYHEDCNKMRDGDPALLASGVTSYAYRPEYLLSRAIDNRKIEADWQTKAGNFTKRLSKYAYKNLEGYKVPPEVLARVGDLARAHSKGGEVLIETTRDLNQGPDYFFHSGSCWWTDYNHSRCTLKSNGGFGLRSFGPSPYDNEDMTVSGRAWVLPLKQGSRFGRLVPTFQTQDATAYLVFNGYGDLEGYASARVVAAMTGLSYRQVSVDGEYEMYVNSGGYLISSQDVIDAVGGSIVLDLDRHSILFHEEQEQAREASATVALGPRVLDTESNTTKEHAHA